MNGNQRADVVTRLAPKVIGEFAIYVEPTIVTNIEERIDRFNEGGINYSLKLSSKGKFPENLRSDLEKTLAFARGTILQNFPGASVLINAKYDEKGKTSVSTTFTYHTDLGERF